MNTKSRRGSLVLEGAVAIGLVGLALVLLTQTMMARRKIESSLQRKAAALTIASNELERWMAVPWERLNSPATPFSDLSTPASHLLLPEGTVAVEVQDLVDFVPAKEIRVTVKWLGSHGAPLQVELMGTRFQPAAKSEGSP